MQASRSLLLLSLSALASPALADASAGIFAILDEVILEPSDRDPDRARLTGVFVLPQPVSSGLHQQPRRGELYFSLNPADPEGSRGDWQALRDTAGSGEPVAFAEYWMPGDLEAALPRLPESMRRSLESGNGSFNTSLVVGLQAAGSAVLPEPYPRPNARGVLTRFDSEAQLCPRFGPSSSEIIAGLLRAYDPERPLPDLPVCAARVGLIDNGELDSVFRAQDRDPDWALAVETLLGQRVAESGVDLVQLSIECRYTICQAGFVFPSAEYQRATGISLSNAIMRDVPGFVGGGKVEDSRSGESRRDYWIQRRAPE